MKRTLALVLALLLSLSFAGALAEDFGAPVKLVVTLTAVSTDTHAKAMLEFEKYVEEASGGNIDVEVYTDAVLFTQEEEVVAVAGNDAQMSLVSASWLTTDSPWVGMFAAGYTDVARGERGSTEEHLTTVQFKVMKEQEALDTIIAQQQNAEQAVRLAQASREEAEHEAEVAQKKLISISNNSRDIETFVQRIGSADELLPDTGMLETARSYRAGKALPVIKKLVRKLREVYSLLVNERQKNNDMLRETAYWKRKAEPNKLMQEKASKLDRLTRTLGADEIDRLLSQRSSHERSRYKAWENSR